MALGTPTRYVVRNEIPQNTTLEPSATTATLALRVALLAPHLSGGCSLCTISQSSPPR